MTTKNRFPIHVYSVALALVITLLFPGCHSQQNPLEQQPTAEEQKKFEQDYQKAMEEQKKLTSGYGKSMQYVPPSTGYDPKKALHAKQSVSAEPQTQPQH
jgi:PBP1b-binding outer membrane lipoprotein LpoB